MEKGKPSHHRKKLHLKLRTVDDLARHLRVPAQCLRELATILDENKEHCPLYRSWERKKKSGGTRPIDAPQGKLKEVQKRINQYLLQRVQVDKGVKGGVQGKTLLDNVRPHVAKPVVMNFDLEDFFLNIPSGRVYDWFCSVGCSPDVASLLTRLTTFKGRIPQGAPTSSMLATLLAGYADKSSLGGRLQNLVTQHNGTCSIWVDDIAISGPPYLRRFVPTIAKITQQARFSLNQKKSTAASVNEKQMVTGIVVNIKPSIARETRKKLRAMLYQCKTRGPEALIKELGPKLKSQLRGKISYVQHVNPVHGRQLLELFNSIQWPE